LVETNLTLSKAIKNLIINIKRTRSFKVILFNRQHICPVWWTSVSTDDGIPMGPKCAPILADLFLHDYEADFFKGFLKNENKKLPKTLNFSFRSIDAVLSLNNSRFGDNMHLS
jgi:hypothetical protein